MELLNKSYDSNNVFNKGNYVIYKDLNDECYCEIMEVNKDGDKYVLDDGKCLPATKEEIRRWEVTDELLKELGFKHNQAESCFEKEGLEVTKVSDKYYVLIATGNFEIMSKEEKNDTVIIDMEKSTFLEEINYIPFNTVNGLQNILQNHEKDPLDLSQWKGKGVQGDKA